MAKGEYQAALERLQAAVQSQPENADAHFLRGVVLVRLGRTDDATEEFELMTRHFPSLSAPYNNLAVLYASKGALKRARVALERAIQLDPADATAYENLGDLYSRLAANAYDRAVRLDARREGARGKLNNLEEMLVLAYRPVESAINRGEGEGGEPPSRVASVAKDVAAQTGRRLTRHQIEDDTLVQGHLVESNVSAPQHRSASPARVQCVQPVPSPEVSLGDEMWQWLEERGEISGEAGDSALFRVYLPPRQSRAEAVRTLQVLWEKGVENSYIISKGTLKNAVSLGVYRYRRYAQERVQELRHIGVEALLRGRSQQDGPVFRVGAGDDGDLRPAFGKAFPGYSLEQVECQ